MEYLMVWYIKTTKSIKEKVKAEFREDSDPSLSISRFFKRIEDSVQLVDNAKFP